MAHNRSSKRQAAPTAELAQAQEGGSWWDRLRAAWRLLQLPKPATSRASGAAAAKGRGTGEEGPEAPFLGSQNFHYSV